MKISFLSGIFLILLLFTGCTFSGRILFAVYWDKANPPDLTWTIDVPNIPTGIANFQNIEHGQYYVTQAGTYTVFYDYTWTGPQTLTFDLTPNDTFLGKEDAFYDLLIYSGQAPVLNRVPQQ